MIGGLIAPSPASPANAGEGEASEAWIASQGLAMTGGRRAMTGRKWIEVFCFVFSKKKPLLTATCSYETSRLS
jgi:hypothetical protein